jgi:glucuronate isomerase
MAKDFMNEDFLLDTPTARQLFHQHAEHMPIIDYHCHLSPQEIAEDHRYRSITELWLGGDHYKWRAMRTNGVDERYITGDASDWEKFEKWAETIPYAMGNPLYHWTHLELRTAFGITKVLNADTAREIYDECNEKLQSPEFSARSLMRRYHVETVCTTDDPVDSLEYHRQLRREGFEIKVLPAWRPDRLLDVDDPKAFNAYVDRLAEVSGVSIRTGQDLLEAIQKRHDFFAAQDCKLSDHGLPHFYAEPYTEAGVRSSFARLRGGQRLEPHEAGQLRSALLYDLAVMDADSGWVQQFHYGPMRNCCTRLFRRLGRDIGCDSMGDDRTAASMARFLDRLDRNGKLAKTILYNLNPADNYMVASMTGNFQDGSCPGKLQWGAAWWFSDQKPGIEQQLSILAVEGLLSRFVGMLTDSRSFLSYPRHKYFRRILCNLIGDKVERGELPSAEMPRIGRMVEDISYYNAKRYFGF